MIDKIGVNVKKKNKGTREIFLPSQRNLNIKMQPSKDESEFNATSSDLLPTDTKQFPTKREDETINKKNLAELRKKLGAGERKEESQQCDFDIYSQNKMKTAANKTQEHMEPYKDNFLTFYSNPKQYVQEMRNQSALDRKRDYSKVKITQSLQRKYEDEFFSQMSSNVRPKSQNLLSKLSKQRISDQLRNRQVLSIQSNKQRFTITSQPTQDLINQSILPDLKDKKKSQMKEIFSRAIPPQIIFNPRNKTGGNRLEITNQSEMSFESSRIKKSPYHQHQLQQTILKSQYFNHLGSNSKTTEREMLSQYQMSQPYLQSILSPNRNNSQIVESRNEGIDMIKKAETAQDPELDKTLKDIGQKVNNTNLENRTVATGLVSTVNLLPESIPDFRNARSQLLKRKQSQKTDQQPIFITATKKGLGFQNGGAQQQMINYRTCQGDKVLKVSMDDSMKAKKQIWLQEKEKQRQQNNFKDLSTSILSKSMTLETSPNHQNNLALKNHIKNSIGVMANNNPDWTPKSSTVIEFVEPVKQTEDPYRNNESHNQSRAEQSISESRSTSQIYIQNQASQNQLQMREKRSSKVIYSFNKDFNKSRQSKQSFGFLEKESSLVKHVKFKKNKYSRNKKNLSNEMGQTVSQGISANEIKPYQDNSSHQISSSQIQSTDKEHLIVNQKYQYNNSNTQSIDQSISVYHLEPSMIGKAIIPENPDELLPNSPQKIKPRKASSIQLSSRENIEDAKDINVTQIQIIVDQRKSQAAIQTYFAQKQDNTASHLGITEEIVTGDSKGRTVRNLKKPPNILDRRIENQKSEENNQKDFSLKLQIDGTQMSLSSKTLLGLSPKDKAIMRAKSAQYKMRTFQRLLQASPQNNQQPKILHQDQDSKTRFKLIQSLNSSHSQINKAANSSSNLIGYMEKKLTNKSNHYIPTLKKDLQEDFKLKECNEKIKRSQTLNGERNKFIQQCRIQQNTNELMKIMDSPEKSPIKEQQQNSNRPNVYERSDKFNFGKVNRELTRPNKSIEDKQEPEGKLELNVLSSTSNHYKMRDAQQFMEKLQGRSFQKSLDQKSIEGRSSSQNFQRSIKRNQDLYLRSQSQDRQFRHKKDKFRNQSSIVVEHQQTLQREIQQDSMSIPDTLNMKFEPFTQEIDSIITKEDIKDSLQGDQQDSLQNKKSIKETESILESISLKQPQIIDKKISQKMGLVDQYQNGRNYLKPYTSSSYYKSLSQFTNQASCHDHNTKRTVLIRHINRRTSLNQHNSNVQTGDRARKSFTDFANNQSVVQVSFVAQEQLDHNDLNLTEIIDSKKVTRQLKQTDLPKHSIAAPAVIRKNLNKLQNNSNNKKLLSNKSNQGTTKFTNYSTNVLENHFQYNQTYSTNASPYKEENFRKAQSHSKNTQRADSIAFQQTDLVIDMQVQRQQMKDQWMTAQFNSIEPRNQYERKDTGKAMSNVKIPSPEIMNQSQSQFSTLKYASRSIVPQAVPNEMDMSLSLKFDCGLGKDLTIGSQNNMSSIPDQRISQINLEEVQIRSSYAKGDSITNFMQGVERAYQEEQEQTGLILTQTTTLNGAFNWQGSQQRQPTSNKQAKSRVQQRINSVNRNAKRADVKQQLDFQIQGTRFEK